VDILALIPLNGWISLESMVTKSSILLVAYMRSSLGIV